MMRNENLETKYRYVFMKECPACGGSLSEVGLRSNGRQRIFGHKPGLYISIVRCRNCRLVFPNPIPFPESIDQHYDLPADEYFSTDQASGWEMVAKNILKLAQVDPCDELRILDVGSGRGYLAQAFHTLGNQVVGLEPSSSFYGLASRTDGPHIVQSTLEDADIEGPFDLVVFLAVFEHLHDPIGDLKRASDLLSDRGRVCILNVPNSRFAKTVALNMLLRLLMRPFVVNCSPLHPPFHLWEFQRKTLLEIGSRLGLHTLHFSVDTSRTFSNERFYRIYQKLIDMTGLGQVLRVVYAKRS